MPRLQAPPTAALHLISRNHLLLSHSSRTRWSAHPRLRRKRIAVAMEASARALALVCVEWLTACATALVIVPSLHQCWKASPTIHRTKPSCHLSALGTCDERASVGPRALTSKQWQNSKMRCRHHRLLLQHRQLPAPKSDSTKLLFRPGVKAQPAGTDIQRL